MGGGTNDRISHGVSSDTSDTSLDGVQPAVSDSSHGVSSDISDNIVPETAENVKSENDERRKRAFTKDMTPTTFDIKKSESSTAVTTQNAIDAIQEDSVSNSLSQTAESVKRKNYLSENTQTQKRYGDYNVSGEDVGLYGSSRAPTPTVIDAKEQGTAAQTEVSPLPSLRDTFPIGEGKGERAESDTFPKGGG